MLSRLCLAIHLMFIRLALLRLVRNLSRSLNDGAYLKPRDLLRHRRRSLSVMRIFLSRLPASFITSLVMALSCL